MHCEPTSIPDVELLLATRLGDHCGFLSETFHAHTVRKYGIHDRFAQENHTRSIAAGAVLSDRDQKNPYGRDFSSPFDYRPNSWQPGSPS
ncbi:MAG: dTDP-4-dehydrorhamnose 3,5-epimerase family protein [Proteobacteria bacterium]|nr:dTDP-4-dehydrorhamnose 3,5-epimerase family protein [Pseudomonadota bacterium]